MTIPQTIQVKEKEKSSSPGTQDSTEMSSIERPKDARSQDLQHRGVGIQVSPESFGIENDFGAPFVEDNLKYFMGKHASGSDLPANDLVLQLELEKLRLQVEETKLKTVQEETQLARARLNLRKLEVNTNSGDNIKYIDEFKRYYINKITVQYLTLGYNKFQRKQISSYPGFRVSIF